MHDMSKYVEIHHTCEPALVRVLKDDLDGHLGGELTTKAHTAHIV
jgi:hypothetical protein